MPAERAPEHNTADNSAREDDSPASPQLESTPAQAEAVMVAAINMQYSQNYDDSKWLAKLGLRRDVEDEIWLRLTSRGGEWIEFVRQLSDSKGDSVTLKIKHSNPLHYQNSKGLLQVFL